MNKELYFFDTLVSVKYNKTLKALLLELYVIFISEDEYDILVKTQIRGKAKDEC